jgi:hypothetical protein
VGCQEMFCFAGRELLGKRIGFLTVSMKKKHVRILHIICESAQEVKVPGHSHQGISPKIRGLRRGYEGAEQLLKITCHICPVLFIDYTPNPLYCTHFIVLSTEVQSLCSVEQGL